MQRPHLFSTTHGPAAPRGWAALLCVLVATIVPDAAAASGPCAGDCNGDGAVTVDEIVHTVNAALGNVAVAGCPAADLDDDHTATVDEIVQSIVAALNGCAENCPVRFDDVSASSQLVAIASATAVAAGDVNADGFPDLYIGRAAPASGIYLENRGGWFVDATRDAALGGAGSSARSVLWADVDNDDDLDLLVGTERADGGELWINDGYGRFVDEAAQRAAVAGIVGDDVDVTDADGDGWIDVVAASPEGGAGAPGSLLRNRGAEFPGYFVPEPTSAGPATGEGSIHFDFDNDGDLDQAATAAGALRLWRNDEAALVDATAELGVASIAAERMVALDHDDDGDLDLLVMADGALRLLRNACGNRNAWIDVRLRGRHSHRGGAGARVQVTAHDGAIAAERMVDLSARRGTQRALAVHAGLGPGSRPARAVEVRWPSGAVQVVEAQPARSVVTIDEPPAAGAGPVFNDVTRAAGLWYTQQRFADAPACPSAAVLFDELLEGGERAAAAGYLCFHSAFRGGAAVADFDGDGHPDLFVTRMFESPLLFRNRGDGTFVDVATARGIDLDAGANAATWADIDNDGDADLIIGTVGAPRSFLYVNDGSGHFSEEALARGVAWPTDAPHWEVGVAVGDYDRDGWVDIYFAGWGIFRRSPSRLLRNRGAEAPGQFEDVTAASGADVERLFEPFVTAFSPAFVDLDGDGFQDLAVTAEPDQTRLFWNQGDGTFRDGTVAARVNRAGSTMGMTFGDLDFDGRLDWFISNLTCTDPYQPRQGPVEDFTPHQCGNRNNLFMSTSGREFTDRSFDFGLAIGHFGWGTGFTDYDNDGDLDLAFVNGLRVPFEGFENYHHDPMRFWRNDGAGEMAQVAGELGLLDQGIGSGLVLFDYDGDGDEDLYIVNVDGPPRLYRNDGGNRLDWIEVEVVGTTSNRDGLGARVTVQAHAGAPRQLQEIGARTHYLGQSDRVARFGLGSGEESVAEVRVDWPASGTTQTFREVARNQRIVVVEGDGGLE